tara:strand:+ start:2062 stop:2244 length:183 start_codon:yes stop_codon:yes gene_type:complete
MKTLIFILVIMKGSEQVDEADFGSHQDCSWHASLINRANTGSPYSAYCKPKLKMIVDKNG